jgi:hypothetical protein
MKTLTKVEAVLTILFVSGLWVVVCSCAHNTHDEKLSDKPEEAAAQIRGWVPFGTSQVEAQRIMEQHNFSFSILTNSTFGDVRKSDFIYCDRRESAGWPVVRRWQVALFLTNGDVAGEQVSTGLIGP